MPGLAFLAETTVPKITVFPILTTTDPSACLAKRPVSIVMFLPSPKSIFSTNNCGIINFSFLIFTLVPACRQISCVVVVVCNPMKNRNFSSF